MPGAGGLLFHGPRRVSHGRDGLGGLRGAQAFLWTSFLWLARRVYVEYWQDLIEDWEQSKLVREWQWRKLKRLKGME